MTDDFEDQTYVFIVRIWAEQREIKNAEPEWRGAIEMVSSTDKLYFKTLDAALAFVVEKTGAEPMQSVMVGSKP
ncbi:MAG: hypothetical protein R2844_23255 [Caldilineales bacterium]